MLLYRIQCRSVCRQTIALCQPAHQTTFLPSGRSHAVHTEHSLGTANLGSVFCCPKPGHGCSRLSRLRQRVLSQKIVGIVHVHARKAGGTTMGSVLSSVVTELGWTLIHWEGHTVSPDLIRQLQMNGWLVVGTFRDPIDRIISSFNYEVRFGGEFCNISSIFVRMPFCNIARFSQLTTRRILFATGFPRFLQAWQKLPSTIGPMKMLLNLWTGLSNSKKTG